MGVVKVVVEYGLGEVVIKGCGVEIKIEVMGEVIMGILGVDVMDVFGEWGGDVWGCEYEGRVWMIGGVFEWGGEELGVEVGMGEVE